MIFLDKNNIDEKRQLQYLIKLQKFHFIQFKIPTKVDNKAVNFQRNHNISTLDYLRIIIVFGNVKYHKLRTRERFIRHIV